jgi:tellurite resistance protein
MARVVVLVMLADGEVDQREIELLGTLQVYELLGLSRAEFAEVVRRYFADMRADAGSAPTVSLASRPWIDAVIGAVRAQDKRERVAAILLTLAGADGAWSDGELAVLGHVLREWNVDAGALADRL